MEKLELAVDDNDWDTAFRIIEEHPEYFTESHLKSAIFDNRSPDLVRRLIRFIPMRNRAYDFYEPWLAHDTLTDYPDDVLRVLFDEGFFSRDTELHNYLVHDDAEGYNQFARIFSLPQYPGDISLGAFVINNRLTNYANLLRRGAENTFEDAVRESDVRPTMEDYLATIENAPDSPTRDTDPLILMLRRFPPSKAILDSLRDTIESPEWSEEFRRHVLNVLNR